MDSTLKLYILQPTLRDYRVEVYNKLAKKIRITLAASDKTRSNRLSSDIEFHHLERTSVCNMFTVQKPLSCFDHIQKNDVLLMNSNPKFLSNIIVYLKARKRGAKVVFWNHGHTGKSPAWRTRIRYSFERLADRNLLYYKSEVPYAEKMGITRSHLFYTGNTINTDAVLEQKTQWSDQRLNKFRADNSPIGKKLILYVGRVTEKSNFKLLLKAFQIARKTAPELQLVVIGAKCDELAKQHKEILKLGDSVLILGEIFDEAKLAPWFLISDVFFYAGSVGLSLIHAFAYGLPALIHDSDVSHMPEASLMKDGYTGFTFQKDSTQDAAKKLVALANSKERLKIMSNDVSQLIHTHYSINQMVQNMTNAVTFDSDLTT